MVSKIIEWSDLGKSKTFFVKEYIIKHKSEKYVANDVRFGSFAKKAEEAVEDMALTSAKIIH